MAFKVLENYSGLEKFLGKLIQVLWKIGYGINGGLTHKGGDLNGILGKNLSTS